MAEKPLVRLVQSQAYILTFPWKLDSCSWLVGTRSIIEYPAHETVNKPAAPRMGCRPTVSLGVERSQNSRMYDRDVLRSDAVLARKLDFCNSRELCLSLRSNRRLSIKGASNAAA